MGNPNHIFTFGDTSVACFAYAWLGVMCVPMLACGARTAPVPSDGKSYPAPGEVWIHVSTDALEVRRGAPMVRHEGIADWKTSADFKQVELPTPDDGSKAWANVSVDSDVCGLVLGRAVGAITMTHEIRYALEEREGAAYVPIVGSSYCACAADEPHVACIQPTVRLLPGHVDLLLDENLVGPCRTAKPRSRSHLYAPPPLRQTTEMQMRAMEKQRNESLVPRGLVPSSKLVLTGEVPCHTYAWTTDFDQDQLSNVLRRAVAAGPGCPYATIDMSENASWNATSIALLAALDAGLSPSLRFSSSEIEQPCDQTIAERDLPLVPLADRATPVVSVRGESCGGRVNPGSKDEPTSTIP